MTTAFPDNSQQDHLEQMLSILNIEPTTMADQLKLRNLIHQIEKTGAQVNSLFPSAHIITVETNSSQTEILRQIDGIARIS